MLLRGRSADLGRFALGKGGGVDLEVSVKSVPASPHFKSRASGILWKARFEEWGVAVACGRRGIL